MKRVKSITTGRSLLAAVAIVSGLVVGTGQLTAASTQLAVGPAPGGADSMQVGGRGIEATVITADDHPQVFASADKARDGLGFPVGVSKVGRHVHDTDQKVDYDEVSEMSATGQPLALTQFDGAGRLKTAVRFDMIGTGGSRISGDAAAKAADRSLKSSGLAVSGQARTDATGSDGGWDIHWDRVQDGLSVRGDEVRVHVWPDGRIQTIGRTEHELAAAPTTRLSQADARSVATAQLNRWSGSGKTAYAIAGMSTEWVGPNAAFDATKLDDAPAPYRLSWVINVKPTGTAADYVRLITLYVDAGDGSIIGGDVVE